MSDVISVPKQEWAKLEERARTLALEKSYLQLVNNLMNQLNEVPGVENTAEAIVRLILDNLGGTNVAIYYQVGSRIHYTDVYGKRKELDAVDDTIVHAAFDRREFVEEVRDFADTRMMTSAFTKASYWALPLMAGERLIGVLKMEGMLMSAAEIRSQLAPFFDYATLVLNNEIEGYLRTMEAAHLAAIVQSSDDAIIGKNLDGIITSWNKGAERIYGYSHQEMLGRPISLLLPPGREDEVTWFLAEIKTEKHINHYETLRQTKDGHVIPVSLTISPIKNAAGSVVGASTIARDITERKQAEEALRASEERFRSLVEQSPLSTQILSPDGRTLQVNRAFETLWGVALEDLKNYNLLADQQLVRLGLMPCIQRAFSGEAASIPSAEYDTKDSLGIGNKKWVQARIYPVKDNAGSIREVVLIHEDITERKRAEREIALLSFALNNVREAALLIDKKARFCFVNEECCRVLSYTRAELLSLRVPDIDPDFPAEQWSAHWEKLKTKRSMIFEGRHRTKDGRLFPVEINANYFEYGGEAYNLALVRDITERKRAEMELHRANRALRTISECNQVLVRASDEVELLRAICQMIVKEGGYRMVWVGFAKQDKGKTLLPVAHAGYEEGYLEKAKFTWADNKRGRGPGGTAIRTGRPAVCHNVQTDPNFAPWRLEALKRGYAACAVFPLLSEGKAFGALAIYSLEPDAFDVTEVKLLTELADDLAYGILSLRAYAAREQAEAALRERERNHRIVADHTYDWEFWLNPDGRFLYTSPSCEKITGYKPADFEADPSLLFRLVHPEDRPRFEAHRHRTLKGHQEPEQEFRIVRSDGTQRWIGHVCGPVHDETGRFLGVRGSNRDITERKKSEQILLARLRLGEFAIKHTLEEVLRATLDEVEAITGSFIGFYHFLEPDQKTLCLQTWSTRTLKEFCTAEGKGLHYNMERAGVWVDCIRQRRPVIHNDYAALPHRKGMLERHAKMIRELVVPVFRGDRIVAILGVGNKPVNYNDEDIKAISLLADFAWDITERKRAEMELHRANRALRTISECNQVLVRASDEVELLRAICQIIVKEGGYRMVWVGFAKRDKGKTLLPVAHAGCEEGYLEKAKFTWADNERGRGPGGTAIRTGRPAVCHNVQTDPNFAPWRLEALKRGYAACAVFPLLSEGKAFGALAIYSSELDAFDVMEVKLLTELADDLAYGILALRTRADHQRAEESLRKLSQAVEQSPACVVITDMKGDIEYVNRRFTQITGYTVDEVIGKNPRVLKSGKMPEETYRELWATITAGKEWDGEILNRKKNGELFWEHALITPIKNDSGITTHYLGIKEDITARKRADDELRRSRESLRALFSRLQQAREGERRSLARTVHDVLGQSLTALQMNLSWFDVRTGEVANPALQKAMRKKVTDIAELVDSMTTTVQTISSELRPSLLEDVGLAEAIRSESQRFESRSGITCKVEVLQKITRLEAARATTIFRIFQEIMTNVARHSRASRVCIRMECRSGSLLLEVRDNGRGIPKSKLNDSHSLGLIGMRERVMSLAGEINIEGREQEGTTVTVRVPVKTRVESKKKRP